MAARNDFYRILQVDPSADPAVIEAAYKKLAYKYHPDVNPTPEAGERMREINEAYATLSDVASRRRYDQKYGFGHGFPETGQDPVYDVRRYPAPLWLRRLWIVLGVVGILFLLRLSPRAALIIAAGWFLSAVIRLLIRRRAR